MGLKTGIFGGGGKLTWNRFTGPGRLAIQTMFIAPLEGAESNTSAAATGGIAGALIGGTGGSLRSASAGGLVTGLRVLGLVPVLF